MKCVVVTEVNKPWVLWAGKNQFQLWPFAATVQVRNGASLNEAADRIEQAARLAGAGGIVVMSVGHGGLGDAQSGAPFFDMGPMNGAAPTFRVAGRMVKLTGTPGADPKDVSQIDVFYDFRPVHSGGTLGTSRKQDDENSAQSSNPATARRAKVRLAHWDRYLKIGKTLEENGVGALILLTCKIGVATEFLQRAKQQLRVPIGAYKRRVVGQEMASRRARIFLEGDKDGQGTNIEMGEFWIPMPPLRDWAVIL